MKMLNFALSLSLLATIFLAACSTEPSKESIKNRKAAETYVELGITYLREGEYESALDRLQRSLELEPDLASAHDAIAILYERLRKMELADEHYRRSVALAPESARAHNNYGRFLCAWDKNDDAQKEFKLAYSDPLYKNPWVAYTNAGVCELKQGDEIQAETYFRKALQLNPKFTSALGQMVVLTSKQGTWLSTRAYLQRFWEVAPRTAQSLWLGIQTESVLGDRDATASYSLLLRSRFPDSIQVKQLKALQQSQNQSQPR